MRPCLALLLVAPTLLGQSVSLSDPSRPATLRASILMGTLKIVGHGGRDVVLEGLQGASDRYPGMRRIGSPVEVRGNVVQLHIGPPQTPKGNVVVKLPYGSTVEVKAVAGGPLVIEDVRGSVEAEHVAGDIRIHAASGTIAANTVSGDLLIDLAKLDGPVNLATLSGRIELSLPKDAKADLKAHLDLRNRFRCTLPLKEDHDSGEHGFGPLTLRGTLNGGGTPLSLRTMSGSITVKPR